VCNINIDTIEIKNAKRKYNNLSNPIGAGTETWAFENVIVFCSSNTDLRKCVAKNGEGQGLQYYSTIELLNHLVFPASHRHFKGTEFHNNCVDKFTTTLTHGRVDEITKNSMRLCVCRMFHYHD